jgi:predicted Zn-dependent peptidase
MRGLDRDDPDRYALAALNHVLGGGISSRLFQEIRETRGLAYSVYSYREGYADTGLLALYAGTAPSRAIEVLELLHHEVDRVVKENITAKELELAKGHVVGSLALSLEDTGARMSRIGRSVLVHGHVPSIDEVVAHAQSVTLDEVARVIERVLAGPRVLAVVGPFDHGAFDGLAA